MLDALVAEGLDNQGVTPSTTPSPVPLAADRPRIAALLSTVDALARPAPVERDRALLAELLERFARALGRARGSNAAAAIPPEDLPIAQHATGEIAALVRRHP